MKSMFGMVDRENLAENEMIGFSQDSLSGKVRKQKVVDGQLL